MESLQQPWEMTRAEWERARRACQPDTVQSRLTRASGSQAAGLMARMVFLTYGVKEAARAELTAARRGEINISAERVDDLLWEVSIPANHLDVVRKALREGREVPAHVLCDYTGVTEIVGL